MPLVSIIMNCHNGERYLSESIRSIISQIYKNWELVFFDNNSNDNSSKIIKSFNDTRIKFYYSKKKLKLYNARNQAITKAKGKYITFLDTDDLWNKNKLKKQVAIINRNRFIKVLYSNFYVYDQKKKIKFVKHKSKLPSGNISHNLIKNYRVGILTLLLKKKIFEKYKFNTSFNIIGDFDLIMRLSLKYKIYVIQEPLATYRIHYNNFSSERYDIYCEELKRWINLNKKRFYKLGLSLNPIKFFLFKLKIKNLIKFFFNISSGV